MVACDMAGTFGGREAHVARVLVVDDHTDTVDALQMLLARAGYDVCTACSGAEALSSASQFAPDLAILDLRMPDMSGYDLARRLRDGAAGSGLRLIALSSCHAPNYELAAYFDEVARKPISGAELLRLLRRLAPR